MVSCMDSISVPQTKLENQIQAIDKEILRSQKKIEYMKKVLNYQF